MFYLFATVFGWGSRAALTSPIVAWLFGLSSHGAILGIIHLSAALGDLIGPVVAGSIFDITSSYQPAFITCAIASITGIILAWLL